jgi:uncharacterized damage-inducible protein DinB
MTQRIVLLQALSNMPRQLADLLTETEETDWQRAPHPGAWSALEVLRHLLAVEARYRRRLERIVAEERPMLPAIRPEIPARADLPKVSELLTRFQESRAATVAFIKARSPDDWQRVAVHETRGVTDFHFLVELLVEHDQEHQQQIIELQRLWAPQLLDHGADS